MRKFDEDKSANNRLKKLRESYPNIDIRKAKEFNESTKEWHVTTQITVWHQGFKKESVGFGSMSVNDSDFGWSALAYAETTSLGRAIGLLGLIDEPIVTDLEVEVGELKMGGQSLSRKEKSSKTIDSNNLLHDALSKATKKGKPADNDLIEDEVSKEKEDLISVTLVNEQEDIPVMPPQETVMDDDPEPEPEVETEESKEIDPDFFGRKLTPMKSEEVFDYYESKVLPTTKIRLEDLPGKNTKARAIELIVAFLKGNFEEIVTEIVSDHMSHNVSMGMAPDFDLPAYLLKQLNITFDLEDDGDSVSVEDTFYSPKAIEIVSKFIAANNREFPYIKTALLAPSEKAGKTLNDMQSTFEKLVAKEIINYSKLLVFFKEGTEKELKYYFTELLK